MKKKNQRYDPCPLPYLPGGVRRVVFVPSGPPYPRPGPYCTFLWLYLHPPRPALVEETSTAAASGVSCWVSLSEGQELPARLLSPAHDNNSDRGKIPPADDREEKKKRETTFQNWIYVSREGPTVGLNGAVARLVTAQVYLANQQNSGWVKKNKKKTDWSRSWFQCIFSHSGEREKKKKKLSGIAFGCRLEALHREVVR